MSDETTLLPCPFCGSNKTYPNIELDKHWVECRECTAESGCYRTEAEAIAAWNTRTHGTLTAEQVREAIERHSTETLGCRRQFMERDWQAIADELNAELGSGTCENLAGYPLVNFECSKCGCEVYGGDEIGANIENGHWNLCPNCGRRVK